MGTAIKHHVPDWVKLSFVNFDIRARWAYSTTLPSPHETSEGRVVANLVVI